MNDKLIGFIGQGWIGKNYADDFENRGYDVVRYGLEESHVKNGDKISDCDIVFIAVPTPTTTKGFDSSILRKVIKFVGNDKVAVIKSTILPGTTKSIQEENKNIYILHSPEFLTMATAAYDAANPIRNIIGVPIEDDVYHQKAKEVLDILPKAHYEKICNAHEAEFIKYGGNNWFYFKVLYINLLYELVEKYKCNWDIIKEAMAADPRIGSSHMNPVHDSGEPGGHARQKLPYYELHLNPVHKSGRGAGGNCFIKDFAAFHELYEREIEDEIGKKLLKAMRDKNLKLLIDSKKDLDLLKQVYGEDIEEMIK